MLKTRVRVITPIYNYHMSIRTITLEEAIESELLSQKGTDGNANPLEAAWTELGADWWFPGCKAEDAVVDYLEWHPEGAITKVVSKDGYAFLDSEGFWFYSGCVAACTEFIENADGTEKKLLTKLQEAMH